MKVGDYIAMVGYEDDVAGVVIGTEAETGQVTVRMKAGGICGFCDPEEWGEEDSEIVKVDFK